MSGSEDRREHMTWDPTCLFSHSAPCEPFAVILLNQPIAQAHQRTVKRLWECATLRLCADGGANRLYEAFGEDIALPHEIRGDLDSLYDHVRDFYSSKGVIISRAASQYATDLQKCILRVEEFETSRAGKAEEMDIVILGGLSGRLDQTMHTLHVLCQLAPTQASGDEVAAAGTIEEEKMEKNMGLNEDDDYISLQRRKRAWVLSENSLVWILSKGSHLITADRAYFGPTCGLMPFASQLQPTQENGPRIWTKGLEWDLDGQRSAIGGFLSTSNHLKERHVRVTTEAELVWTMEVRPDQHV